MITKTAYNIDRKTKLEELQCSICQKTMAAWQTCKKDHCPQSPSNSFVAKENSAELTEATVEKRVCPQETKGQRKIDFRKNAVSAAKHYKVVDP